MPVRMTAAQAAKLAGKGRKLPTSPDPPPKKKKARSTVPDKECAPNRCCTCGYTTRQGFGEADEDRHVRETGHLRYQSTAEVVDAAGRPAGSD